MLRIRQSLWRVGLVVLALPALVWFVFSPLGATRVAAHANHLAAQDRLAGHYLRQG